MKIRTINLFLRLVCAVLLAVCCIFTAEASEDLINIVSRPDPDGKPTRVEVGMWIIDIDSIDSVSQSFDANLYIILKWNDPRLIGAAKGDRQYPLDEIWSPKILIVNESGIVRRSFTETVQVDDKGTVKYQQRYIGKFSQPHKLKEFPFDRHSFYIQLVTANVSKMNDIIFTPYSGFSDAGMKDGAGIASELSLPDWKILEFNAKPAPYEIAPETQVPGYALEFKAKRDSGHYVLKVILPLILIVCMSWSVFWIHPSRFEAQISLAATSMLTLIAYRFTIDSLVPKVAYMTRLDQFILSGSVLVFLTLIQANITGHLFAQEKTEIAIKIDRYCRIAFPAAFILATLVTLVW